MIIIIIITYKYIIYNVQYREYNIYIYNYIYVYYIYPLGDCPSNLTGCPPDLGRGGGLGSVPPGRLRLPGIAPHPLQGSQGLHRRRNLRGPRGPHGVPGVGMGPKMPEIYSGNGWKWMEMDGNGWKWMEMDISYIILYQI